jgi:hypothetical protein
VVSGLLDRINVLEQLLGEKGTAEFVAAVRAYRDRYGSSWLEQFKLRMPHFTEIIDLCANYEFDEAWDRLCQLADDWIEGEPNTIKRMGLYTVKTGILAGARPDIEKLHAAVRYEIDRPR